MDDSKKQAASVNICHQVLYSPAHRLPGNSTLPSTMSLLCSWNPGTARQALQLSNVQDSEHRSPSEIRSPCFSEEHARVNLEKKQIGWVLWVMNYRIFSVSKVSDTYGPQTHGAKTQEKEKRNRGIKDGIQRGRSGSDIGKPWLMPSQVLQNLRIQCSNMQGSRNVFIVFHLTGIHSPLGIVFLGLGMGVRGQERPNKSIIPWRKCIKLSLPSSLDFFFSSQLSLGPGRPSGISTFKIMEKYPYGIYPCDFFKKKNFFLL